MTRDLKAAYRSNEHMTLDERTEAQRLISAEYRAQVGGIIQRGLAYGMLARETTCPIAAAAYRRAAEAEYRTIPCEPNKNMVD